ncbi:MAG: glycosyltransferase family 4 protein [Nocardioidaceae bacterium]
MAHDAAGLPLMRVGLVCPYSLSVPGGVQQHVLGLAGVLREHGHQVSVLAPDATALPGSGHGLVSAGRALPLPYKGAVGRVAFGPVTGARVSQWLERERLDLVHVHEPLTPSASLHAVRRARVPVVATFHTAQDRPRALAASAVLLRRSLAAIAAHIAVSPTAARTVRGYLPVEPLVIPNGLDVSAYGGPRRRAGETVLFLGRLDEPRKGLPVLLRHWPEVGARHGGARLILAGPGRPRRLPGRVAHLGEVSEKHKRQLLRDADIVVAPNTHGESFGYVLVEAMAAGTTVVANALPAFRDVLGGGEFGMLYQDPRDLPDALTGLLHDSSRRAALASAAAAAVRAYDWSVVAPQILDVYRSVLAGPQVKTDWGTAPIRP